MAQSLAVALRISALDRASAPLRGLSRSAGSTRSALAKLGNQSSAISKLGGLQASLGGLGSKLDASRKRTGELGRALKATESPTKKLRSAFERSQRETVKLSRAHRQQKGELKDLSASLRKAGIDTRRLGDEQARLDRSSGRLQRRLDRLGRTRPAPRAGGLGIGGALGGLAGYGLGRGLFRGFGGFIETASKFETLETTLGTIEGSSEKARQSTRWISDFAARTPFELDQVSEAFVKLRAYGMDPTNGLLRTLGDTASGMGKDVMQAVEAIADAVTGENERLKEFGIKARMSGNRITYEYSDSAGRTRTDSAAKTDREGIQRVLTGIMNERFAGAMEDRMATFGGMLSKPVGSVDPVPAAGDGRRTVRLPQDAAGWSLGPRQFHGGERRAGGAGGPDWQGDHGRVQDLRD